MQRALWLAAVGLMVTSPLFAEVPNPYLETTLPVSSLGVDSIAWSPDGRTLATGGLDEDVTLWNVAKGLKTATVKYLGWVDVVAYSPDGKTLAVVTHGTARNPPGTFESRVRLWDVASEKKLVSLRIGKAQTSRMWTPRTAAWSPDGRTLAATSDGHITLWDVQAHKHKSEFGGATRVYSLAWSQDGKTLASADDGGKITLWDTARGQAIRSFTGQKSYIFGLQYSPDNKMLASSGDDNTVRLWDAATGKRIADLKGHSHELIIHASAHCGAMMYPVARSVAFSPDGTMLASASDDRTVIVWNVSKGKSIVTLKGHSKGVTCVAFSPDGKFLASAGNDSTVKLWRVSAIEGKRLSGSSPAKPSP